ncbi:MAG: hypothetical protein ACO38U_01020, partial [Burkholderiaceae bacterium]
ATFFAAGLATTFFASGFAAFAFFDFFFVAISFLLNAEYVRQGHREIRASCSNHSFAQAPTKREKPKRLFPKVQRQ